MGVSQICTRREACGHNRSFETVLYPREQSRLVGQSSDRLGASMGGLLRDSRRGWGAEGAGVGGGGELGRVNDDAGRGRKEGVARDAAEPVTVGDEWKEARTAEGRM